MAKTVGGIAKLSFTVNKKTSQGHKNIKRSSMNKGKKRSFKKYRGQGK
jgi:hypothetical protein